MIETTKQDVQRDVEAYTAAIEALKSARAIIEEYEAERQDVGDLLTKLDKMHRDQRELTVLLAALVKKYGTDGELTLELEHHKGLVNPIVQFERTPDGREIVRHLGEWQK